MSVNPYLICHWNVGMMEHWNNGLRKSLANSLCLFDLTHHSIIQLFHIVEYLFQLVPDSDLFLFSQLQASQPCYFFNIHFHPFDPSKELIISDKYITIGVIEKFEIPAYRQAGEYRNS